MTDIFHPVEPITTYVRNIYNIYCSRCCTVVCHFYDEHVLCYLFSPTLSLNPDRRVYDTYCLELPNDYDNPDKWFREHRLDIDTFALINDVL